MLMLLHEETGYVVPVPEWQMSCALAGAVLMDLAIENKIDTDLTSLTVIDTAPTGDALLDPTLAQIASETSTHNAQYWVERIAQKADHISDSVLERLVSQEILDFDSAGFWSLSKKVSRSGRYPTVDGRAGEEIKSRIMRVLLDDELPDPRDLVIIGLVHFCGAFRALLTEEEFEDAEQRIELFANMDLIGRSIGAAVRSAYRPPQSMRASPRKPVPKIGARDVLRSKHLRKLDFPRFFADMYRKHGPVCRIGAGGRDFYVIAGTEVNQWVNKKGRLHLRTRDYIEDFLTCWGTARAIASMDGAEHYRMRKAVRYGNSRGVIEQRLPEIYRLARRSFKGWGIGKTQVGEDACQQMIGEQVAELSVSTPTTPEVLQDLLDYEYRALLVHITGILPKFTLQTPAMKRKHANILNFYTEIHASHTEAQRKGKVRDLVDDIMALHHNDPQYLPETDLGFAFIAPIIAGHYTGSAVNFLIYDMLTNPEIAARLQDEADALFAGGDPSASDLTIESIDVAHRFVLESMRLHPVVPVHARTAMNAIDIEGMQIPVGSFLLVAFCATHFLEENFPEPEKFDIDRYLPPRSEHKNSNAYAPFGVGTHTCLGQRWTELQMAVNLLLIAHHLTIEMVPANYQLKLNPFPKMSPNNAFRFRVKEIRNPLE